MPTTRLDAFDRAVQTANVWLSDIENELGTEDRRFAYRVLRTWLHTLRDRLPVERAARFAAQLPELLRGVYYDGWEPGNAPVKYGVNEYVVRFGMDARIGADEVPATAQAVTAALQRHFSGDHLTDTLALLPHPLRALVSLAPQGSREADAPSTPVQPVDQRIARLEEQVQALAEALGTLARGLEEIPANEPGEVQPAKAARLAHEILLSNQLPSPARSR